MFIRILRHHNSPLSPKHQRVSSVIAVELTCIVQVANMATITQSSNACKTMGCPLVQRSERKSVIKLIWTLGRERERSVAIFKHELLSKMLM